MKIVTSFPFLVFLLFMAPQAFAQPANDDCAGAFQVTFSTDEEHVILTNGDSRGATASATPLIGDCSGTFYTDDTWYTFTTPALMSNSYVVMRAFFGDGPSTDVPAIGMALYESCGAGELPIQCFSSTVPEDTRIELPGLCLLSDHTYLLRVWSTGNTPATEGTFRIGVYPVAYPVENELWVERFDSDPFSRGWSTFGIDVIAPDSSINAVWDYLPNGTIQPGAFTPATTIPSESFCDGAIGVNSDFNDNGGSDTGAGTGSVPTALNATGTQSSPATYVVQSPSIFMGDWDVSGITIVFDQAVRELNSTFTLSYRNRDEGEAWSDWVDFTINEDVVPNADPLNNIVRQALPDAHKADSIQLKLTYLAHYYYWIVDDFKIIETECTNTRVQSNFFAIAPFAKVPKDQVYPFAVLADIYNAGACPQTNVTLNLSIQNVETNEIVYNEDLHYGTVDPDSLAQNKLFPELVNLPSVDADYRGTYTLTQDDDDFDPTDNEISFLFSVGGKDFADEDTFRLENGFTQSIAVNNALYTAGAPLSYAYGNYFKAVTDAKVASIEWGASNTAAMAGKTVNVYLEEWTDVNGDQIAEADERTFVGVADYTFTGAEPANSIMNTVLENFDTPGEEIWMRAGHGYMAIVEYAAAVATDPQFFMLASDEFNYSATQLAMDSAIANGIAVDPLYFSVLGFSPDGNIGNIDYEVTELDVNDSRIFFGNDVVPVVRIIKAIISNTNDPLTEDNLISVYPNPVSDQINIRMDFKKPYRDVELRLINNIGQTVLTKTLSTTLANHIEPINVSSLAVGNYMLQVETADGQRSLPVMVVR